VFAVHLLRLSLLALLVLAVHILVRMWS
jgi:hypothetical protein